jgi:hypothetical protein
MKVFRNHNFENFAKLTENLHAPLLIGSQENIKFPVICVSCEQLWVI